MAGPRSPAPSSAQGPAVEEKTQPQRVTKYNKFYGCVRYYTYISWRAERVHLGRDAADGRLLLTGRKLQQLVRILIGIEDLRGSLH